MQTEETFRSTTIPVGRKTSEAAQDGSEADGPAGPRVCIVGALGKLGRYMVQLPEGDAFADPLHDRENDHGGGNAGDRQQDLKQSPNGYRSEERRVGKEWRSRG